MALVAVLVASASVVAQETLPPPYQRDGEIYFDSQVMDFEDFGGATSANWCMQLNSFVEFRGMNRRTVGNGLIGQTVDADGALLNAAKLIADGLLARDAVVRVTTFGKEALKSGVRSSKVRVNGCVAQPDLLFHYGRATSRRIYHQELRVDAACLRYGVRPNENAVQPDAKENRIRIETAEMLPDELATECGDHGSSWVSANLKGDALWWDEQNPSFRETRLKPVADGGGEENARLFEHHSVAIVEFEALAPIALVHGYRSDIAYWSRFDPDRETAENAFDAPLKQKKVAFEAIHSNSRHPKSGDLNIEPGDVGEMGGRVKDSLTALARKHGADHVNVITHSMGALWAREAIRKLKASPPSDGAPSVFMLVTVAPMHKGSILADLAFFRKEKYKVEDGIPMDFLEKFVARLEGTDDSTLDATTFVMLGYNEGFDPTQDVGVSMTAKGRHHLLKKWTVPTSFNRNENCNSKGLELVECDSPLGDCVREKRHYMTGAIGLLEITRDVLQRRSEKLQWYLSSRVWESGGQSHAEINGPPDPVNCPGGGSDRIPCTPGCPDKRYPLNDYTLRTDQMFFADYVPFVPPTELPGPPPPRAFLHKSHSGIADAFLAGSILRDIMQAETQRAMRRE